MANVVHSTLTGIELHYSKIQVITGTPNTIPTYIGQTVYDYLNKIFYIANGIVSTANWIPVESGVNLNLQTGTSYSVVNGDNQGVIALSNTAARTITLLAGPMNGFGVTIKDEAGTAYTNNIIITASGSDTFLNGTNTDIIDSEYASKSFQYDATNLKWIII